MIQIRVILAMLAAPAAARWCQLENVKGDVYGNFTYAGAWRVDGCTTLSLDHGRCSEIDCPWRIKFTDEEIVDLADKLHGNEVLLALSISANNLTDESAVAISEAMRQNNNLLELNLQENAIGDQGAIAIAEVIRYNVVFHQLNLAYNNITDEGAQLLLEVLKSEDSALETLNLRSNRLTASVLREIEQEMRRQRLPPEGYEPSTGTASELGDDREL